MKTITKEELHKVLEEHKLWLDSNSEEGAKADLSYTILRNANLVDADLRSANLRGAKLSQASTQNIKGLKVYSIDNIGTFNGKVTYIPSLDRVYAGCWVGSLEAFLEKGLEMNEGNNSKLEEIRDAYCFFSKRK
ncbi:hypothetical protein MRS_176 [Staphylococcus phage MR003]|nr:hypothetical protein MRS_176 [Staphylococcus phage MR003]